MSIYWIKKALITLSVSSVLHVQYSRKARQGNSTYCCFGILSIDNHTLLIFRFYFTLTPIPPKLPTYFFPISILLNISFWPLLYSKLLYTVYSTVRGHHWVMNNTNIKNKQYSIVRLHRFTTKRNEMNRWPVNKQQATVVHVRLHVRVLSHKAKEGSHMI